MNLLKHAWIPIIRQDGKEEMISPSQITSGSESGNPVVAFNSSRPDLDAALWQFCIGLFQSISFWEKDRYWLQDEEDYRDLFLKPPDEAAVAAVLSKLEEYFVFEGEGPLFLQDFGLENPKEVPIDALMLDSPGENTLKENRDHFIKRDRIEAICPVCCASALFNLQNSASSGGVGYMTSIRGGGPLNTLVYLQAKYPNKQSTVWQNILANLIPYDSLETLASDDMKLDKPSDIFPWMKPTVTSEAKTGRPTRTDDIHPFHVYWGMPRRIRIDFENRKSGYCDLCGKDHQDLITQFHQQNYGTNYKGNFFHPFSPYLKNKSGEYTAMHAQPGGIGYRHFHGIVVNNPDKNITRALVVENAYKYADELEGDFYFSTSSLGYDSDKGKCRNWYEAVMPRFNFQEVDEDAFFCDSRDMVTLAENILKELRSKISEAMYGKRDPRRKELWKKTFWQQIEMDYWKKSEGKFYPKLKDLLDVLAGNEAEKQSQKIKNNWYVYLWKLAFDLFEQSLLLGEFQHGNPKRVVSAWVDLRNSIFSKKFREENSVSFPEPKQEETT